MYYIQYVPSPCGPESNVAGFGGMVGTCFRTSRPFILTKVLQSLSERHKPNAVIAP